jgi:hypothetical protein
LLICACSLFLSASFLFVSLLNSLVNDSTKYYIIEQMKERTLTVQVCLQKRRREVVGGGQHLRISRLIFIFLSICTWSPLATFTGDMPANKPGSQAVPPGRNCRWGRKIGGDGGGG